MEAELQVALKINRSYDCSELLDKVKSIWAGGARIIEVDHHTLQILGVKFVLNQVTNLLKKFNEPYELVADLKFIEDFTTIKEIKTFGAHSIIIAGSHNNNVLKRIIRSAKKHKVKVYVNLKDLDKGQNIVTRAKELERMGVDSLIVHTGFDTKRTIDPFEEIRIVSRALNIPIAAAGNIREEHISRILTNGASRIIIGSAIRNAKNPEWQTRKILEILRKHHKIISVKMCMRLYADQIYKACEELDVASMDAFLELLLKRKSKKIYLCGTGRSKLVASAFAMRLMHLGFNVHVIGEVTLPAVSEDDVFITISGSGETTLSVLPTRAAKEQKATIVGITSNKNSTLGKLSDLILWIPGRLKESSEIDYIKKQIRGHDVTNLSPLGSLFEILCLIVLEGFISQIFTVLGASQQFMKHRHSNIET